jgi:hypothetical protein
MCHALCPLYPEPATRNPQHVTRYMSKREKILVGLMSLAIIYGIFVWFLSSPQQAATLNGDNEQKALNAFVIKVAEKTTSGLSNSQAYVLKKAAAKWQRDPLVQIEPRPTVEKEETSQPVLATKMTYTGFLRMGDKRLAIINGMEYEIGDILEPDGFIVRSISPRRIVIAPPGAKKKTIILPMEETE